MKAVLILTVIAASLVSTARAQNYTIDWFTIDGGGTSTGGVYSLSGTIGQPDAGTLTNGQYTLVGGFWGIVNLVQTPGGPLLGIERLAGGNVRVYWPLPATGFTLERTPALTTPPGAISWNTVPFPYQTNATQISITVPGAGTNFYRLHHP
jgi:hypothetical protein